MNFGLRLPPAKVSTFLVLVFLGFGVLIGRATRQSQYALAASAGPIVKVVGTQTSSSTTPSSAPSSESTGEPPESEVEPTPTPEPKSPKKAAAKSPSSNGKSSGEEKEPSKPAAGTPATKLPAIKHVFVIMLSDQPYAAVFGPESSAHYLAHTLEHKGELLVRYDAVAHEELANEIALLSGQGPTTETAADCATYTAIEPASIGASEQVQGNGCVYPSSTQTLPGQLTAKHLGSRAYVEGIDEAGTPAGACAHPALGQPDPTSAQGATAGPYATFRNPLVYFQSLAQACAADDVGLARLKTDLGSAKRTPSLSYIVPDRCHDGNPASCTAGAPAGLGPADAFLQKVVPEITASKAYKQDGLIVITTDEAPSSGAYADSSSCCGQPRFPNLPATTSPPPRGGGTVGALLLSPYVKGGATSQEPFNHFSLLRTIEDLFGLKHLGYAALSGVKSFDPGMFTAGKG